MSTNTIRFTYKDNVYYIKTIAYTRIFASTSQQKEETRQLTLTIGDGFLEYDSDTSTPTTLQLMSNLTVQYSHQIHSLKQQIYPSVISKLSILKANR